VITVPRDFTKNGRSQAPAERNNDGRRSARASQHLPVAKPRLSIGILLAEHFTLTSFALFTDLLRLAADEGDLSRQLKIHWSVLGAAPAARASCGVTVSRTSALVDPTQFDYLVIVGGLLHAGRPIDARTEDYLREAARRGVPLVGMCTGSFILARAGLMEGRCACVSWYHHQDFLDEFPGHRVVADRIFLVDGDRVTLPGGAGAADFALYLIERHLGVATARKAQEVLQFDRMRAGSEAPPHPPVSISVDNPIMRRVLLLMEQNIARPINIAQLAGHVRLSSRQLERLFRQTLRRSPAAVYRELRMRYAEWLLKHSRQSITDIALSAGFADGAHFSRQYRRQFGAPPSRLRLRPPDAGETHCAGARVFE
jgi:transcriptional regulator GlxA family with amidase domain